MRLLEESVLRLWHERRASARNKVASAKQRAEAIQQHSIASMTRSSTRSRSTSARTNAQRDRLREQLTLVEIDRHENLVDQTGIAPAG
jgi:F0F1-type ATP synthase membrane subunit b/b'